MKKDNVYFPSPVSCRGVTTFDSLGHLMKNISLPKQRKRKTTSGCTSSERGSNFQFPVGFSVEIAFGKLIRGLEIPPPPRGTGYHFVGRRGTKEAAECEELHCHSPF